LNFHQLWDAAIYYLWLPNQRGVIMGQIHSIENTLDKLADIVGLNNVSADHELLHTYSRDQSFVLPGKPDCVVYPNDAGQVQEIISTANRNKTPIIPRSSTISVHGASIPVQGGIIVDLKRMNRILSIDKRNWQVAVEPGVSFTQLQAELGRDGFRVAVPFLCPPSASVLSTYLERNPVVTAADFTYGNELIISYNVVMPTGENFTVGHPALDKTAASSPDGPGLNFYKLFQAAQGTLGIVTSMTIRILPLPSRHEALFIPCIQTQEALDAIWKIQRSELGLECFALNNFNLSMLLTSETPAEIERLQSSNYIGFRGAKPWSQDQLIEFNKVKGMLPKWTVITCLAGWDRLAEEKIEYQKQDIQEAISELGCNPQTTLGDFTELPEVVSEEVLLPYKMQKRFGYKGSCHGLAFYAEADRLPEYEAAIYMTASKYDYSGHEIGGYILPIERGRSIYCEFEVHCNLDDPKDKEKVCLLFDEASEILITKGAFFDRPYGKWSPMVYAKAKQYSKYLKKIKKQFDPNNIMNPGKLCF